METTRDCIMVLENKEIRDVIALTEDQIALLNYLVENNYVWADITFEELNMKAIKAI